MPLHINKNIKTGISKANEKANIMLNTKSKYLLISVITKIPSGAELVKKLKIQARSRPPVFVWLRDSNLTCAEVR